MLQNEVREANEASELIFGTLTDSILSHGFQFIFSTKNRILKQFFGCDPLRAQWQGSHPDYNPALWGSSARQGDWQEAKPHINWWAKAGWSQTSQAEETSQDPIIWQVEALWNIADGWEVTAGKEKQTKKNNNNSNYSSTNATEQA